MEEKYADKKKFFRTLPLCGHVGLPKDKLAMSLVLEDIPLRQEIAATITVLLLIETVFSMLFRWFWWAMRRKGVLCLLVAVELILNREF